MMDKSSDAIITISGNQYALFRRKGRMVPHMVELSTGEIPLGEQRPLLKHYLLEQGINLEPWEKKNTHWCINQAIRAAKQAR